MEEREILVFDVEANNLLHRVTKVWCICLINASTKEIELYHDRPDLNEVTVTDPYDGKTYVIPKRNGSLSAGARRLHNAGQSGKLVCHNVLGYDDALLKMFFPKYNVPLTNYHDTLIQSKVQWFERKQPKGAKGTHGLQAWGVRAGIKKPDIQDWSYLDAFKLHRCIEDVKINLWAYEQLENEAKMAKEKIGLDFTKAMEIEHKYRYHKTQQELRGAYVDKEHMLACIDELDKLTTILRDEIEPELPPSIKVKAVKIDRKTLMEIFGRSNPRNLPEEEEIIIKDGKALLRIHKNFYKPVMSFTKTIRTKDYSAMFISKDSDEVLLQSKETFEKLKLARDWTKEQDVTSLGKGKWVYPAVESVKTELNSHTCEWFGVTPDSKMVEGVHTRIEWNTSKLSQSAVVKRYLISLGWEPTEWNAKKDADGQFIRAEQDTVVYWPEGAHKDKQIHLEVKKGEAYPSSPKLTEDSFESLPEGIGRKIANYNTYTHRRSFISNPDDTTKGLLNQVREDGRLPCGVNCFGTATGRSSHYNWVNAAGVGALYGDNIRKIIIAPEGRKLVGADMKSAQLSIAAYYANNWEYYDAIVNGEEVVKDADGNEVYVGESGHCVNARAFGLVEEAEWHEAIRTQDKDLLHSIMLRRKDSKACLPVAITEVLSRDGWKRYEDLSIGMEVLTYNRHTEKNEYAPIEDIQFFNDKEVVEMGNSNWSFQSTGNHRWLGKRRTSKIGRPEVEEFLTTDTIKSEFKLYNSAVADLEECTLDVSEDDCELIGWLLGDGYYKWADFSLKTSTSNGNKRGLSMSICQSDKKYKKELMELISRIKAGCGENGEAKANYKICGENANYQINAKFARDLLTRCGFTWGVNKHELPLESFVLKLDNKRLSALYKGFFLSEGYVDVKGGEHIAQNSGNILDSMVLCAYLLGKNPSINSKGDGSNCFDVRMKKKSYTGSTKFSKTSKGVMSTFCITTKNGTFVAKQGDIITITGNCTFGTLFGCSGKKLAKMAKVSERKGSQMKTKFLNDIGLNVPIERCIAMVNKYKRGGGGYVELPMGYYAHCKQEHKLFNYLDQGTEGVMQKIAVNWFEEQLALSGLDAFTVLDYHRQNCGFTQ